MVWALCCLSVQSNVHALPLSTWHKQLIIYSYNFLEKIQILHETKYTWTKMANDMIILYLFMFGNIYEKQIEWKDLQKPKEIVERNYMVLCQQQCGSF